MRTRTDVEETNIDTKCCEIVRLSMKKDKPLVYSLYGKKRKGRYYIKVAESELIRILCHLRPARCVPEDSQYPLIRDLIELKVYDVDGYVDRMKESDATIWFENEPYERIVCSAGHARGRKVFFLHADVWEQVMEILACGMDLKKEFAPSKTNAYFGLAASNSTPVAELPRIVVIDDFEMDVEDTFDVVRANMADKSYELERGVRMKHETNLFDGGGLVSVEQATRWAKELGLKYVPAAFQIRALPALKGVLFTFDVKKFAETYGRSSITDKWGVERGYQDIDVIVTKSMFKFHGAYDNYEQWEMAFKTPAHGYHRTFNIAAWSDDPKELLDKGDVNTNYQMLQTLDLGKKQIRTLARATVEHLKKMRTDPEALLKYLRVDDYDEDGEDNPWYQIPPYFKALKYDKELLKDEFIARKVNETIKHIEHRAYSGKLKVKGNYQILAPDIFALAQHAFGLPVTGILQAWEIYSHYWNSKDSVTEVDMVRSPHVANEHCVMKLNNSPEAAEWFRYQTATIVTSIYDTSVLRCNGADFDGDKILTTKNRVLLDAAKAANANTILAVEDKKKPPTYAMNDLGALLQADKISFKCDIGELINPVTKLWSLPPSTERDRAIAIMSVVASAAIDAAKTGVTVKIPPDIEKLLKEEEVYKPTFMQYRKNESGTRWNDRDCTMNRVCAHVQEELKPFRKPLRAGEFSPTWLIRKPKPFATHGPAYKRIKAKLLSLQDEYNGLCLERDKAKGNGKAEYNSNIERHFSKCRKQLLNEYYGDKIPENIDKLVDYVIQLLYYDESFVGVQDLSILWHAFGNEMIDRAKGLGDNKSQARQEEFEKRAKRRKKNERKAQEERHEKKVGIDAPVPICQKAVDAIAEATQDIPERRIALTLWMLGPEPIEVKPCSHNGISPTALCGLANVRREKYSNILDNLVKEKVIERDKRADGIDIIKSLIPRGNGEVIGQVKKVSDINGIVGEIFPK